MQLKREGGFKGGSDGGVKEIRIGLIFHLSFLSLVVVIKPLNFNNLFS